LERTCESGARNVDGSRSEIAFGKITNKEKVVMERHDIMEMKTFVDGQGREVRQYEQVFGKNKPEPFLKGRVMVKAQRAAPNGMPMPPEIIPFEFLFVEGTGLKKAFEIFDEIAKLELEEHSKKMREKAVEAQRIQAAKTMPNLTGPDGKTLQFPAKG
jgi:hypothetical protein